MTDRTAPLAPAAIPASSPLTRVEHWPTALFDLVEQRMAAPFAWGSNDCCLFAADAVLAITGQDLAADLRGTYSSAQQAARVLKRLGGVAAIPAARGLVEVPPLMAQRGDLLLMPQQDGQIDCALYVCTGSQACAPGQDGLKFWPIDQAIKAWRVGA